MSYHWGNKELNKNTNMKTRNCEQEDLGINLIGTKIYCFNCDAGEAKVRQFESLEAFDEHLKQPVEKEAVFPKRGNNEKLVESIIGKEVKPDEVENLNIKLYKILEDFCDISYEKVVSEIENLIKKLLEEEKLRTLNEVDYYAQRNIECTIYENEVQPLIRDIKIKYDLSVKEEDKC